MTPKVVTGFSAINNEICVVKVKCINISLNDEERQSNLLVSYSGGECVVEKNNFFDSMDSLKKQIPVEWGGTMWVNRWLGTKLRDDMSVDYWVMENGIAVHKKEPACEVFIHVDDEGRASDVTCPQIPEDSYETSAECYSFNDITIVNADGTKKVEHGIANLCMLTAKQEKIMQQLEKLAKEAKECGLIIVHDWNGLYAFNQSNVEDYQFNYCDNEASEGFEMVDLSNKAFKRSFDFICHTSEEDNLYVKRKQEA